MKKILFLILILFSSNIFAETFNIIVSGKPGGTFHTRSMLMHDALVDAGHQVNLINAGDIGKSSQIYKTTSDPVIMPWIDSANLIQNLQPNQDTFLILEYRSPIVFCSKLYKDFDVPEILIGHSASWPIDIFDSLEQHTGNKVKPIPYRNSNDLLLGFLANEIDYIAISLSKLNELPASSCFAVTSNTKTLGINSLDQILPNYKYNYINQHAYWLARNQDVKTIREIIISAIQSEKYKNWIQSQLFISDLTFNENDLQQSQQGALDWGLKQNEN